MSSRDVLPIQSAPILRFRRSERLLHWAIALPFLVCLSSAMVLVFYYNPMPSRPHRALVSWIHRGAGLGLLVLPLLAALVGLPDRRTHWENVKEGWRWSLGDVKWLLLAPVAALRRSMSLPDAGKFNAGQKLNFMWTMTSWLVLSATGLVIWASLAPDGAWSSLRTGVVAWLVHFGVAALSLPLIAGHLFMALVNPSSRAGLSGIFTGYVDRDWLAHHHARWFRARFAGRPDALAPPPPSAVPDFLEQDEPDTQPFTLLELSAITHEPSAPQPRRSQARR